MVLILRLIETLPDGSTLELERMLDPETIDNAHSPENALFDEYASLDTEFQKALFAKKQS